jgi:hypothetical protein
MARTKKTLRRQHFVLNLLRQSRHKPRRSKTQSIRKSQQCVSNTRTERRCRKRTAHTNKCWIHLAKQNNLHIKPSNVAEGRADYAVCNNRGHCVDSTYTTDAAARFVNDSRGTSFQNNSKIKGRQMFRLKATKKIPANHEIFTSYGDSYWGKIFLTLAHIYATVGIYII